MMSNIILEEYKILKILGEGGFGKVYLTQNSKEQQFAIKQMNKQKIGRDDPDQLEYIYNEVSIMKQLNSQFIVKLYKAEETAKYLYLIMECCNGGDLKKDQIKQPNKVYSLDNATKVLADVIRGLEVVHTQGYLHRDIKIDNILVNVDQNGNKTYKVADFGLSKMTERGETVLGTGNYMSPEIYKQETYGFQIDMWAFGVVFYFMLNKDFPFRVSPHVRDCELIYKQLMKQAENFSYLKSVQNTKMKLVNAVTPQLEDLFSKIFNTNPQQRITFSEIRKHPVFIKRFPDEIKETSKIMYKKNMRLLGDGGLGALKNSQNLTPLRRKPPPQEKEVESENVDLKMSINLQLGSDEGFPKQKTFLHQKNQQIEFLWNNFKQFKQVHGVLTLMQKFPLCYNLVKYYIILKKKFINEIKSQTLFKQAPHLKLRQYKKTLSFKKQYKEFGQELDNGIFNFDNLYSQCQDCLEQINKINDKFQISFTSSVIEMDFDDPFKKSYRKSTLYTFDKLKKFMRQKNTGNKFNYFLALSVICHVFNRIFKEKENAKKVFREYLEQSHKTVDEIDYGKLREWMSGANPMQLNAVTKSIINKYFEVA